tara:strand:+ start:385 stop:1008 length:624 start_codon:yes stop_codon:yes gene_type:complete
MPTTVEQEMKILVACEESQSVTTELRAIGHDAYSCDILPASGKLPEYHLQQDVIPLLRKQWDMVIAFPPCTHLASSGAAWFEQKRQDGRQQAGIDFFMLFTTIKSHKVVIENPVGIMSRIYRKPDQIIQPWWFGDPFEKRTCLWLKGLQPLIATNKVEPEARKEYASGKTMPAWYADAWKLSPKERSMARSKTFPGIAKAMAQQWAS